MNKTAEYCYIVLFKYFYEGLVSKKTVHDFSWSTGHLEGFSGFCCGISRLFPTEIFCLKHLLKIFPTEKKDFFILRSG